MAAPTEEELKYSILDEFNGADDVMFSAHVDFLWGFYGAQTSDRYAIYYYTKLGVVDWLLIRNWRQYDITEGPIRQARSQIIDNLLHIKSTLKEAIAGLEMRGMSLLVPASGQLVTKAPYNYENRWVNPNSVEWRGSPVTVLPDEELE